MLTAGTTYYITTGAGGGSTITNANIVLVEKINFEIINDADIEADETIDLTLSNPQSGLVIAEVTGGPLIDNHVYTITCLLYTSPSPRDRG